MFSRCVTGHLKLGWGNSFKPVGQETFRFRFVETDQLVQGEKIKIPATGKYDKLPLTRQTSDKIQEGIYVHLIHLLDRIVKKVISFTVSPP